MSARASSAKLVSIQVGQPATYGREDAVDPFDRTLRTAIFKSPVSGPVRVRRLNIEGDGQADLRVHGGVDKAVLAYSADHYAEWREALAGPDLPYGAFGENLSITGLTEAGVCIGDIWQIGEVRLEVSQPRQPCFKLARRWRLKTLPKLVIQTGRCGWYYRVLEEGKIEPGMDVVLARRRHPRWTVQRAHLARHGEVPRPEIIELVALPELSAAWISGLR